MRPSGIVTLTTDFGLSDAYVAAMKGVILSVNPHATIVDVTHKVRPQRVEQGAFLLSTVISYFPTGTVHVAVVDPGVGTARRDLALITPNAFLVGPDNGLLSAALPEQARPAALSAVPLPSDYRAFQITNEIYFRHPVSSTFHGRDIFASAAAHISCGLDLSLLGTEALTVVSLPPFTAVRNDDGRWQGRVLHIDRFGNLVTNIKANDVPTSAILEVTGRRIRGICRTYGEGKGLMAVSGSSGYLEIAVREGNAAALLGADVGTPVIMYPHLQP